KATGISELKLPESLTKIYENSFDETPITRLKLNKNLKILGGFNTLRNLEEFEFNDQLEEILDGSFLNLNLNSLKLPNSLKILGGFQQSNITD
ncbi:leucine-rich repeat protein, partial [Xanthomonas citri pv. citri]|nr:leucine-rich repeat protein [Xanthomonas citri pv. citri]